MHTISHALARYTHFVWGLLQPLGSWGVFAIAAIDGSLLGMPLDPVVAGYVYQSPHKFLLYVIMASVGSAAGSIVLYVIGYKGGEVLLQKRMPPEKFESMRRAFDHHEFWALMFPAMLPPPFPFKLFVLAAAAFEMKFAHFELAIFAGRFVRFLILSLLTIKFGPQVVGIMSHLVHQHLAALPIALAVAIAGYLLLRRRKSNLSS
ncbi:MAG TPA: VTT domain-containing protein [Terriglobales bacterium]|nr:VTT domain-containing protein [Terriglobales bacterium]